jgi:adenylate cyclase
MPLYEDLTRRNVFRVAIAYLALAWLVTEVASTLFPAFGIPDWGLRFLVIVFALGLVPALIISWVYEITPEGLKRETEVVRDTSITRLTAKRLDLFTIGLIVVALAFILTDRLWLNPRLNQQSAVSAEVVTETVQTSESEPTEPQYPPNSIAVLPFVNMSDDPSNEYFSDGMSEEILNLLVKIPELRVISRSSTFSFKGKGAQIPDIARELNVAHILEGSVRKSGNQVRITVQLIEARSDTHLWSETYDRQLEEIFVIQDEIAATVVEQLKITLLGAAPKAQETDPEAYTLYLQARHLGRQGIAEGYEQSNAIYQRALAIEPNYAAAWVGLATNYGNQMGKSLLPVAEGYTLAREAANKALSINPDYAPAYSALGWIAMIYDNDLVQAARHYERALALDPADTVIIANAATLLRNLGRLDESITLNEYATARDPVDPAGHSNLGNAYLWAGRWDEAFASFQTALRLSPGRIGAHYHIGLALLLKGETEAALAEFSLEGDEDYRTKGTALALYALGRQGEYQAKLAEVIERLGAEWPSEVAHVYAYSGDADTAFEWLDKAVDQNESGLSDQFMRSFYTPLHGDPRWAAFLERVGSSPEQLDAIEFKVTLPK